MPPFAAPNRSFGRWQLAVAAVLLALLAGAALRSYFGGGLAATLLSADLPAERKLTALRALFEELGPLAPLAYIGFVTIEVVVAPLPGTMLYAPGGAIFGGFLGGLYATLGNVLGAGLACQGIRWLGLRYFARWLEAGPLAQHAALLERRGLAIVFLLRVNPFTSSDLVSYAAGLTTIPTWKVMLGTLLGMAPLCFAQAYLAESLLTAAPWLVYPLMIACAAYAIGLLWAVKKLAGQQGGETAAAELSS